MSAEPVPFGKVDERTTCPECEASVEVSMTQRIVEQDDQIVVTELGYSCPDCRHRWTEAPEAREVATDGGQDIGELATRLIELREEFEEIAEHVDDLEIRDRELLVEVFEDQAELCLQLAQALEVRAPFDPQDHKLDDDRVLTDGGVTEDAGSEPVVVVYDGLGPAVTATLAVAIATVLASIGFWLVMAP